MRPFVQVARPHDDIIEGRLEMDVFAADLWEVVSGRARDEYQDPDVFFSKTYMTKGLKNILEIARSRLEGRVGDSIVQLQTPFGGGKTHTLVALYHKAKEWKANVVVFDGSALDPREYKPWEELERQLTGKIEITRGEISPGKEKLIKILSENSPVLILMDEILEYITRAAGIRVGDSNLAAQTFAFVQELTGAVSVVGKALLVLTLPSSALERYDENAERMFNRLQKIVGRVERVYTPVGDEEVGYVVRKRLFNRVDENEVKKIVDEFIDYAKDEGLLTRDELPIYREKFLMSYPFKPEVIDVLYKRWGSFHSFQRTRGVLRLLSLVIHDLMDKSIPFIRIGDFNLSNDDIRRELIKHIGSEWDSIISKDITSNDSGAVKVDNSLGSYKPYRLGTVVSTTIFMMSFSGKGEAGCSIKDVKLSTVYPEFPASEIDNVINKLREKLFYLSDEELRFVNQPNLNKIIVDREESMNLERIKEEEKNVIKKHISKQPRFKVYVHPEFPRDVPDTPEFKLVILDKNYPDENFLERFGEIPRVYRNTLIFLCTDEAQRDTFYAYLRKLLALRSIYNDEKLNLTEIQRKELKNKLRSHEQREYEELRKLYRKIFLPDRNGLKEIDISFPTFGEDYLDKEVFEYLKNQKEILEKISPRVIKDKYLAGKDYLKIKNLYEAFLKTPGEMRLISKQAFVESVKEGVRQGLFGFGRMKDGDFRCIQINEAPNVEMEDDEIILDPKLCVERRESFPTYRPSSFISAEEEVSKEEEESDAGYTEDKFSKIEMELVVPVGKISEIARITHYLKNKFNRLNVKVIIEASDGEIQKTDYEDKIIEAFVQSNIRIESQKTE